MRQLIKFALVGITGFAVDVSVFTLLSFGLSLQIEWARGLAFFIAALTTWLGNRHFTFCTASSNRLVGECRKSLICAVLAGLINLTIFKAMTLYSNELLFVYFAFVCGVLVGMVLNYVLSAMWVFKVEHDVSGES
ncbi:GtrA family protein [Pseudoalteromonas luteoviolacea]|uniref:GtrA family protein n=1 Tax=Pseudoalteromonas luteoviolacea TaxID=43657 RepID=UPI001B3644DE|nr:GtrA family protein [Pseudoalteromonas luteoviolacea]MBQ4812466.1 GtrA family protein [Pseudoalteromonas luteoviolacea]